MKKEKIVKILQEIFELSHEAFEAKAKLDKCDSIYPETYVRRYEEVVETKLALNQAIEKIVDALYSEH